MTKEAQTHKHMHISPFINILNINGIILYIFCSATCFINLIILASFPQDRSRMCFCHSLLVELRDFFPFLFSSCRGVQLCPKANRIFCLQQVMSPMPQEREGRRICVDHFPQWLLFPFSKTEPRGRLSLVFHSSFSYQYPMKMVEESL